MIKDVQKYINSIVTARRTLIHNVKNCVKAYEYDVAEASVEHETTLLDKAFSELKELYTVKIPAEVFDSLEEYEYETEHTFKGSPCFITKFITVKDIRLETVIFVGDAE